MHSICSMHHVARTCTCINKTMHMRVKSNDVIMEFGGTGGTMSKCLFYPEFHTKQVCINETPLYT